MDQSITVSPIGFVQSDFATNSPTEEMRQHRSKIVISPEFEPGLLRLEPGKDILVLFHFSRIAPEDIELQLHPRHNPENPLAGVFATRTQFRPNRIGVTAAHLEAIDGNVLTVSRLDALDGTPVLDIKPFAFYFDADTTVQRLEVRQVESLQAARDAIDAIDTEVIRLLGNRAKYVHQVVNFKDKPEDVRAPERYNQVMRRRRELAAEVGLNPDVIEGMYKMLVENFIQEEIEMIRRREMNGETQS
jgi:tRNA-Thr(GGU) m(6)t(6)A37 methyltransferase TsaA